jgi:Raf kinase inhibitor-like YbhB/YbcL family protein
MEVKLGLMIESTAFPDSGRIPDKYTCYGENVSPAISWAKADPSVKSWALIIDDPDAPKGIFTHWVIYNIPPDVNNLPENVPAAENVSNGALQGKNSMDTIGYSGPCPPPGPVHHYNFSLYALNTMLNLPAGASKKQVLDAMKGHIISQGKLIGLYQSS